MDRPRVKPDPTRGPACFAPPIDSKRLDRYKSLAAIADAPVQDAMEELIRMVEKFQETPESREPGLALQTEYTRNPFRNEKGIPKPPPKIVPLEQVEVNRMWDFVPWPHEINAMAALFDQIPNESKKELRDAAFHLIWFARELVLDREPMTNDKL